MNIFLLPSAAAGFKSFRYKYLTMSSVTKDDSNVFRQISKDEYIFVAGFNDVSKMAFNFSMEKFKDDKLQYKLSANRVKFNEKDST
jgi:lipopolysaccharide export system permease protein